MPTYIFNGKVLPERADVSCRFPPMEAEFKDIGLKFQWKLSIGASQVSVVVDTEEDVSNLRTLRNYVGWLVGTAVDALGYLTGRGYDVEITSVVGSTGVPWMVFGVEEPSLENSKSERPVTFEELWHVLTSGVESGPLQRALANLREAIRVPHDTAFFCYRAIESLRQAFVEDSDKEDTKPSWKRMSNALRVESSWLEPMVKAGQELRHGEPRFSSGESRETEMQLTWKVVDRFIEYAQGGYKPLAETEYPVLG